jgi:hypothetical protein
LQPPAAFFVPVVVKVQCVEVPHGQRSAQAGRLKVENAEGRTGRHGCTGLADQNAEKLNEQADQEEQDRWSAGEVTQSARSVRRCDELIVAGFFLVLIGSLRVLLGGKSTRRPRKLEIEP